MMHECYFRDSAKEWALKTGHSWSSQVAEIAGRAQAAKLLLTHVNPLEVGTGQRSSVGRAADL